MYETFDHTADIGLRILTPELPSLFVEAGQALFSMIVPDLDSVAGQQTVEVEVAGNQLDYLLFDWLNELLYLFESRQLLLSQFDVQMTDGGLRAQCRGETMDPDRHRLEHEVKAITYHGLKLQRQDDGYLAEVIVDI